MRVPSPVTVETDRPDEGGFPRELGPGVIGRRGFLAVLLAGVGAVVAGTTAARATSLDGVAPELGGLDGVEPETEAYLRYRRRRRRYRLRYRFFRRRARRFGRRRYRRLGPRLRRRAVRPGATRPADGALRFD